MDGEASIDCDDDMASDSVDELDGLDDGPEDARAVYLPTPEEIRLACLAIQAEWSPAERERRCVVRPEAVETRITRGAFQR